MLLLRKIEFLTLKLVHLFYENCFCLACLCAVLMKSNSICNYTGASVVFIEACDLL